MSIFIGNVIQQNGHLAPPAVPPGPPPQTNWTANQMTSPNITHHSYTANQITSQFGSPHAPPSNPHAATLTTLPPQPNSHWNQPPPQQTPPTATPTQGHPPQQWSPYASPPPVTASNMAQTYYPTPPTPTPNYWAPTSQSDQGFAPKQVGVYNQFSPPPNGAATYPTQYPNIPTAGFVTTVSRIVRT